MDGTTSAIAADLGLLAVKHAIETRADLRAQAERDAAAAQGDPGRLLGTPRAPSVEHVVGSAAHLLLLDASRAVDLAFVRAAAGRFESAALLSDAIGAIGTGIPGLSAIRLAPSGVALGFTLDGHAWSIERSGPAFAVTGVKRDGQPLALGHLATARPPRRSR